MFTALIASGVYLLRVVGSTSKDLHLSFIFGRPVPNISQIRVVPVRSRECVHDK